MSATKAGPTPGPWTVVPGHKEFIVTARDGQYDIAVVRDIGNESNEANALLISAAPDLLDACMAMIEWDDRENDHAVSFAERMELCREAFQKARSAIAKARGEA